MHREKIVQWVTRTQKNLDLKSQFIDLSSKLTRTGSHRQAGPDLRAVLAAPSSTLSKRMLMLSHFHLYGEQRSSGVMGRRNGPSGLRDDDDE